MEGDEEPGTGLWETELAREGMTGERLHGSQAIEAGTAHGVDAPALLAHAGDSLRVLDRRGEVEMRELGDGVADLVVYGALGPLAAGDVRHWQRKGQRGH